MTAHDTATLPAAPLAGRTLVVMRPREQAGSLCERIRAAGGEALLFPVIAVGLYRDDKMGLSGAIILALSAAALILLLWSASRERRAGLVLADFLELTLGSNARHEFRRSPSP